MATFDVIVIGAGVAGLSAGWALAADARVLVLEAEDQPAYHTSGRSAAMFIAAYENDTTWALTTASGATLRNAEADFGDRPLLTPRGAVMVADDSAAAQLDDYLAEWRPKVPQLQEIGFFEARTMVPIINERRLTRAVLDPTVEAIDVHAALSGFQRVIRRHGGEVRCNQPVVSLERRGGAWRLHTPNAHFTAPVVVNAAGAWGAEVGRLAGALDLALTPCRRSALLIDPPESLDITHWPLVYNISGDLYFMPQAGQLMISPADETPSEPCDARPDEFDLAVAVDRFQRDTHVTVERIAHSWAGLRSFLPDRRPAIGFDPRAEGFFWLIGQGGFGVQTAPGSARLAAALILGRPVPAELSALGFHPSAVDPARFGV